MEMIGLDVFLTWLLAGGFVVVVRWIIAQFPVLLRLDESQRAYISAGLGAVLVVAAFVGTAFMGYIPMPVSVVGWIESLFPYISLAIGIPMLMSTAMRARYAAAMKRQDAWETVADPGTMPSRSRLFGVNW